MLKVCLQGHMGKQSVIFCVGLAVTAAAQLCKNYNKNWTVLTPKGHKGKQCMSMLVWHYEALTRQAVCVYCFCVSMAITAAT